MASHSRLVPLIVASPMFLQNIDASAMATALPSIATSLGVPPLHLNLIITVYILSLAVFLPLSGWLADRFGAKRMFCVAIALFSLASALCGMSTSMTALVACRVFQGLAAAMMVPVSRLILLRSVPPSEILAAMVWYTVPPVVGRLAGPLVGGAIVSVASWQWIFFINIPLGTIAVLLALLFVKESEVEGATQALDVPGFLLMAVGLAATLGALDTVGKGLTPVWVSGLAVIVGTSALALYGYRSLKQADPVIDLRILRFRTFRMNVLGAVPLRLALFAVPFLLPLMLQLAFGLSPLTSGVLTAAAAIGSLCTRAVVRLVLDRYGFRRMLLGATVLTGLCFTGYALFTATTPHLLMFGVMFAGGLLSSLSMVSLNSLGFVDMPKDRLSHATALLTMAQQVTAGAGVVLGTLLLALFSWWRGGAGHQLLWQDFAASFVTVGLLALLSLFSFVKLQPQEGHAQ